MVLKVRTLGTVQHNVGGRVSILGGASISLRGENKACLDLHDYRDWVVGIYK